jgi:Zn-dependent peptidase ImmA (M78 family)/rRNA maturation endonuclease Nob1
MVRTKPNYDKAKIFAYKSLEHHKIYNFPIDILAILRSYDDIKIITYSEMAIKRNCSIEEIIEVNSSEDGVIHYSADRDRYLIAYNDSIHLKERVYWTLAHEFGHYILGHHKESEKSNLARNEMSDKDYNIHEVEANFFTRFFLSPPPIIVEAKMNDYHKVMDFFGVSYTAAVNTLSYVSSSNKKGFRFTIPRNIANLFMTFIDKVRFGVTCVVCNCFFSYKGANYCPNCGSNELHTLFKGDEIKMKYRVIELDEFNRAAECPRCKNEIIQGDYCQICGSYLLNKCTGLSKGESYEIQYDITWHDFDRGCGEYLEGDARFCIKCGSTSTYNESGLLESWEDELHELGYDKASVTTDPFAKHTNGLSDDDPF